MTQRKKEEKPARITFTPSSADADELWQSALRILLAEAVQPNDATGDRFSIELGAPVSVEGEARRRGGILAPDGHICAVFDLRERDLLTLRGRV